MRTINFNDEDIKQCKLALVNQNLTSLQSAFLMQHITNIETEIERLNNIIDELEKYIKENTYKDIYDDSVILSKYLLDKLKELKGDSNE